MKIETLKPIDLKSCSELLMRTYNCSPWNNHWSRESADRYLMEFMDCQRFVGYKVIEDGKIIGAAFCHERTWWTADELYIDEIFIAPDQQRKGYGKALLKHIEQYVTGRHLAGITLLSNKYMPALGFYKKNGFVEAEHVMFLYKELRAG